ncbi:MAG TPA: nucleoside-diphosphate sugar epimerase/dehydratase [Nitrospirota bacterium]|nr:nucleoside-diphosphate sugar epimerase/dehydratase [Nitrospirota bacterium]
MFRNRNFYYMVFFDALLVAAAYILAYWLRFDGDVSPEEWINIERTLPIIIPTKIVLFFSFNLYRGMWRYTSLIDMINVFKACTISSAVIILVILYTFHIIGFPRSVFAIDWVMTILLIGGVRFGIRMALTNHISTLFSFRSIPGSNSAKKLLIIGAGDAGEKVLREIRDNPMVQFDPFGFLDDAKGKQGQMIHGIRVIGTIEDLEKLPDEYDEILIAIPSARGDEMRRIVNLCERTGKKFRTLPSIGELIGGTVSVNTIREVTLEDLIGREEVNLDQEGISQLIRGKRILVTGAGGSIGSELVRQISRFHPEAIALLDFSEFNLYQVEMACRRRRVQAAIQTYLADIRDRELTNRIFSSFNPHAVFHAAAYKHVPMQEFHPREAFLTNVLGTRNVAEAALNSEVERFVLVSTDKAVRPTNVMGATKRVAELIIQSINGSHRTRFMAVRFGNVIGSSGSVIPLFQEQIARGGPVTVTHPEVTRYFMSIPEAAQLILQAGAMGEGGEIFILDMGKPINIGEMARDLIRLHGLEPDRDIAIEYIGLRPGEKLYEELITGSEGIVPTTHRKILVLRGVALDPTRLSQGIAAMEKITANGSNETIREKLQEIVPEYTPEAQHSCGLASSGLRASN